MSPKRRSTIRGSILAVGLVFLAGTAQGHAGQNEVFGAEPAARNTDGGTIRRSFDVPERGAPGSSFEDQLRVYNRTARRVRLNVYPTTAVKTPEGVFDVGSEPARAGWASRVTLSRAEVTLEPHGEATIGVTVERHRDLPLEPFAAVVVQGAPSAGTSELDLVQRIAILVRGSATAPDDATRSAGARPGWIDVVVGMVLLASYRWRRRAQRPTDRMVSV